MFLNFIQVLSEIARTPADLNRYFFILTAGGSIILLTWLISLTAGKVGDPLKNAPIRRHFLPIWLAPVLMMLWFFGIAAIGAYAQNKTAKEPVQYILSMVWYLFIIGFALVICRTLFIHGLKGLGLRFRTIPKDLIYALLTLLAILPVIEMALWMTELLGVELKKHPSLISLEQYPQVWMRVLIVTMTVGITPIIEELIFRGLLQSTIRGITRKPWVAILVTSILFASNHPPTHVFAIFFLSVAIGYSYEKSGSLIRAIFVHILFNGLSVLMTLLTTNPAN